MRNGFNQRIVVILGGNILNSGIVDYCWDKGFFEGRPGCELFELQYHGELVFSRDVQSVDLMPWDEEPPDKGLLDRIRAMGVAVRMPCDEREGHGG